MNIPDSIKKLLTEKSADSFNRAPQSIKTDIDDIVFLLMQKLPPECAKMFNKGAAYYKSRATDRYFMKGVMALYVEAIVNSINESSINDDQKKQTINYFENQTKYLMNIFDTQHDFVNFLNQNKKVIDVESISYIILGYAIETLRKIYHTQTQQSNN